MQRRSLLKLAVTSGAVVAASAHATSVEPKQWDETTDILIVGAGGTGLAAAVSAKEANPKKKVVVLEKAPAPFLNSTSLAVGAFNAGNTSFQRDKKLIGKDDAKRFYKEVMASGYNQCIPEILKIYAENCGPTIDWLRGLGIDYYIVPNAVYSVLSQHQPAAETGTVYIKTFLELGKKSGVDLRCNHRVLELITTPDGNEVLGVKVQTKDGVKNIKVRDGVALTCGGFAGDPKMMDRFLLNFPGALSCASPNSTGDGMKMATKIGAATTHMSYGAMYSYGVPIDLEKRRGLIFRGHIMNSSAGSITVGPDGKRFVDDGAGQNEVSNAMVHNHFRDVYCIATEKQVKEFMQKNGEGKGCYVIGWGWDKFAKELEEQKVFAKKANTVEELAGKLGLDPKTLVQTVDTYNGYAKNGKDPEFNRSFMKGPLDEGPFYGFACRPLAIATCGGLRANGRLQVLDNYDKPIKKLYAAGETLGGMHGISYVGGNSIGQCLTTGRYVGQLLAKL
jgi:fumarate reductase flavoprotein subunit